MSACMYVCLHTYVCALVCIHLLLSIKTREGARALKAKVPKMGSVGEYEERWNKTTGRHQFSLLVKVSSMEMCVENVS